MGEIADDGQRIDESLDAVDARLDRLEAALGRPRGVSEPAAAELRASAMKEAEHLLFVPSSSGYEVVERHGAPPPAGAAIELPGVEGRYSVVKVARSPLPGDRRPCGYLELI